MVTLQTTLTKIDPFFYKHENDLVLFVSHIFAEEKVPTETINVIWWDYFYHHAEDSGFLEKGTMQIN